MLARHGLVNTIDARKNVRGI